MEALDRFVNEMELAPVDLVTHDWGVLVGLRWACDHPGSVRTLTISDGGFFADRRWHDLANVMRTPGEGEKLVAVLHARGLRRRPAPALQRRRRRGPRRVLEGVRRRHPPPRPPRALPLRGLREARPLRRPSGGAGAADADRVGRRGPVRERADGRALPPRDPGVGAARRRRAGHFVWEDAPERTASCWSSSCTATPEGAAAHPRHAAARRRGGIAFPPRRWRSRSHSPTETRSSSRRRHRRRRRRRDRSRAGPRGAGRRGEPPRGREAAGGARPRPPAARRGPRLQIITSRSGQTALDVIRHDAAHVLATAVLELYPGSRSRSAPRSRTASTTTSSSPTGRRRRRPTCRRSKRGCAST